MAGVAVSVTLVPAVYDALQVVPQLIPLPLTVPLPFLYTLSVGPDGIEDTAAQTLNVVAALAAMSTARPKNFAIERTVISQRFCGQTPLSKDTNSSNRRRFDSLRTPERCCRQFVI